MIQFAIHYRTNYGEALYIIGSSEQSGNWDPKSAIRMQWNQNHTWTVEMPLHDFEYKYFVGRFQDASVVKWESGPNRVFNDCSTPTDILDVWNYRKVCFQCYNPNGMLVYITGSCEQLGNLHKRITMKQCNGIAKYKVMINILEDKQIIYQYVIKSKKSYSSQILVLKMNETHIYSKNTLVCYYDGLSRMKHAIYQFDQNISYGYVPKDKQDFNQLHAASLNAMIEFRYDADTHNNHQTQKDGVTYIIVNLTSIKDVNFYQRLFSFMQIMVRQYQQVYICNNSLSHLRKYLELYKRMLACKQA